MGVAADFWPTGVDWEIGWATRGCVSSAEAICLSLFSSACLNAKSTVGACWENPLFEERMDRACVVIMFCNCLISIAYDAPPVYSMSLLLYVYNLTISIRWMRFRHPSCRIFIQLLALHLLPAHLPFVHVRLHWTVSKSVQKGHRAL